MGFDNQQKFIVKKLGNSGIDYLKKNKMPKETVEGADLIFDIGNKIIKDFKVKELPLMITFIKALLNNTKFKIDKKLFA